MHHVKVAISSKPTFFFVTGRTWRYQETQMVSWRGLDWSSWKDCKGKSIVFPYHYHCRPWYQTSYTIGTYYTQVPSSRRHGQLWKIPWYQATGTRCWWRRSLQGHVCWLLLFLIPPFPFTPLHPTICIHTYKHTRTHFLIVICTLYSQCLIQSFYPLHCTQGITHNEHLSLSYFSIRQCVLRWTSISSSNWSFST